MSRVESIDQIISVVGEIRDLKKGFITNFYLDTNKHSVWIDNLDLYYHIDGETVFFIKQNKGFINLFYCSSSIDNLSNSIEIFLNKREKGVTVIDLVGTFSQISNIKSVFTVHDFIDYHSLVRMSRINKNADIEDVEEVNYATKGDANVVFSMLNDFFDPFSEQIPYLEEIEKLSAENSILVYKKDGSILGFVIFEKSKSTLYLRYWFVKEGYRDKKIGSKLLNKFFFEGKETKRQLFWVMTDNDNAIKRYEHYGFIAENMYDYVLINR
jgi:ribosomal protein S18 acetylase RimI-like enzyme